LSAGEEKQTALVPIKSAALTEAGAKSLAARGRTDLRIREEAEEIRKEAEDWLRKGLEFRQQGIDETQASFDSTQQALDTEVASGRCISPDEKLAFFDKHFLRDPRHSREQAVACFERGLQLSPTHSELQFRLGEAYFNEWGVPRDPEKAAIWFSKAADSGYAEAQFYFGWICAGMVGSDGSGVPKDNVQATFWWRKGAEQGHADSQHYLGEYYACGFGVERDYAQAAFWIRKAAEQPEGGEPRKLRMYSDLVAWLRSAAGQGVVDAQYLLGWLYSNGRHVPKDFAMAEMWYRTAAEQGDTDAQLRLGLLYDGR
jgi:TPR repeat protein